MEIKEERIEGLFTIQPKVFGDDRGYFLESFNEKKYSAFLGNLKFVQDNQSLSSKGVLRGLHFQNPPFAQGKLVQVIKGSALDVAVDIRKDSPTYGQHVSILLTEKDKNQFWIPAGFAHGFCALEDNTIFSYKCTNYYSPENENSILWNDKSLNIDWTIEDPTISEKDKKGIEFLNFLSPF
jgi:dTDP-4-dehydrorhamnose 3,5-epimerase